MLNRKVASLQLKWLLVISILIVTGLLDVAAIFFFPSVKIIRIITILEVILAVPIVLNSLKQQKAKDDEYQRTDQRLKNIFETLDVAIWSHDHKTGELLITPGIEKLYGYPLESFIKDPLLWKKVILPEDSAIIADRERRVALGETVTSEYRIIRPDGEVRWIMDRGIPAQCDKKGSDGYFTSVLFDITDRKETEDRYRSLVEMSPDIIAVVNSLTVVYINETGLKLLGASRSEEIIGQSVLNFVPQDIIQVFSERTRTYEQQSSSKFQLEFQVKRLDGKTIDVEMASTPILFEGRFAIQIVGQDITERKRAENTIRTMAYYDTLTGLPNRNHFKRYLNEVLHHEENKVSAVLFLDLDRFKIINDTKGHTFGDMILQKAANRLMSTVKDGVVSRQGGDEFIILLENTSREKAGETAQRILDEFTKPIVVQQQEFFVTTSIGISLYPKDGVDEEALIKNADTAMYLAKEYGKNNFQFYSSILNGISIRKMELENNLRKALEQGQLKLVYQPQISLTTGKVVGAEALIRWDHPVYGTIPPLEFIPLAEETGLIRPIGKWVLSEACRQRKEWDKQGIAAFPIAVNVSVRQFDEDQFTSFVASVIKEIGLKPDQLELEITESIMQNLEKTSVILQKLKKLGVMLAIDDFGTGYSSLSYLKHFPIDKIKIDKTFVDDISAANGQGLMVKTIIDMGINLNFAVIAEGIETQNQLDFLKKNHCDIGQGYYYSQPLPASEVKQFLEWRT